MRIPRENGVEPHLSLIGLPNEVADSSSRSRILTRALRARRTEPFEECLGRVVRDAGGDFGQYLGIIGDVREYARVYSLDLRTAAKALARQA